MIDIKASEEEYKVLKKEEHELIGKIGDVRLKIRKVNKEIMAYRDKQKELPYWQNRK